jgi:hypothetical protein
MYDKIKILTFAKGNFRDSQKKLIDYLDHLGIRNQKHLTDEDLDSNFLNKYSRILSLKKGYGYCIWKPYIIYNELQIIKEDEILLYIDSTDYPMKSFFEMVLEHFKENDYLYLNRGYNNGQWTKRDTFVLMNCDTSEYHNHVQLEAGVICLRQTPFNNSLIREWFDYCTNENILTEIPNISNLPNINDFREHRYDQSILTNIIIKNKLKSYKVPENVMRYNFNQPQVY